MLKKKFQKLSKESKALYLILRFEDVLAGKYEYKKYELVSFYFLDKTGVWIALDNITGDCLVEQFKTKEEAIDYVENK